MIAVDGQRSETEPFADELLLSWAERMAAAQFPQQSHLWTQLQSKQQSKRKSWTNFSVNPTPKWLAEASSLSGQPGAKLLALALAKQYPTLPWYWYSWGRAPRRDFHGVLRDPDLAPSWCSRCLAEDYAEGRPAYIRQGWILAYSTFCRKHQWPLSNQCIRCGSWRWYFSAQAGEPIRLRCAECMRYLERSYSSFLHNGYEPSETGKDLIGFERGLEQAIEGRIPDQFRFNETAPGELVAAVLDIVALLTMVHHVPFSTRHAINDFDSPIFHSRLKYVSDFDSQYPLAIAGKNFARKLLTVAAVSIGGLSVHPLLFMGTPIKDGPRWLHRSLSWEAQDKLERLIKHWPKPIRSRFHSLLNPPQVPPVPVSKWALPRVTVKWDQEHYAY